MNSLRLAPDLSLPAAAVTQTFAIVAMRGAGKTNTAVVMAEEMLAAELPLCWIDPVGVAWGLRFGADGKSPGHELIILGGSHGDVPVADTSGEAAADFVCESSIPVIVDLSDLRKGAAVRFMTDFAERLYHRKGSERSPLHVVIDEADAFIPQRPQPGEARLLGACEDLVRRGRSRGLGLTLITQRPAVLNKNVLTQVETLVILRMTGPQDRAAIESWIELNASAEERKEVLASLPKLPTGTGWFWSPQWLGLLQKVQIRRRGTFDSSKTPEVGDVIPVVNAGCAPDFPDLAALAMRLIPPAPESKARPKVAAIDDEETEALRGRVAELEEQLRETEASQQRVLADLETAHQALEAVRVAVGGPWPVSVTSAKDVDALMPNNPPIARAAKALLATPPSNGPTVFVATPTTRVQIGDLGAGPSALLRTLARMRRALTRSQLGAISGYTATGGTFQKYLGILRGEGLVEVLGDTVAITSEGKRKAGNVGAAPTSSEVLGIWRSSLDGGPRKLLDALVDAHPRGLSRDRLGQLTGYEASGGTFQKYLGIVKGVDLAIVSRDVVRANPETLLLGGTT